MKEILFTPAALLDLLSQIDELKDVDLSIAETLDDSLQLTVGDSTYLISNDDITDIQVSPSVVDTVEDVNEAAYEDLSNLETYWEQPADSDDVIESGFLKEAAKTLLVGGIVRLTSKLFR